jgi:hypothetical protein
MSQGKSIPFTIDSGRPAVLRVTMDDGTVYVTDMTVEVFDVIDLGDRNPDGTHKVEIRAGIKLQSKQVLP